MAIYATDKDGNEYLIAGAGRVGPRGKRGPAGPKGDTGDDGNPIGTVISFLGLTAPEGYLVCDGAAYSIADYPALSEFIAAQFGSANHFGGDGTATFAVPDMRNLFLRGYHGAAEEQLSGDVGARQEGTRIPRFTSYAKESDITNANITFPLVESNVYGTADVINPDKRFDVSEKSALMKGTVEIYNAGESVYCDTYTSRPVNMAILYCIKAVKTVSSAPPTTAADVSYNGTSSGLEAETVQAAIDEVADKLAAGEVYSTEEVRIGTWLDKPHYRKVFIGTITALDELVSIADVSGLNIELMTGARAAISSTDAFTVFPAPYTTSYAFVTVLKETQTLCVKTNNSTFLNRNVYVTIEYIKTTDAAEET